MKSVAYDPWIPVAATDGVREVSLRDALVNAHTYRCLDCETPLHEHSILRILLAVLHRAIDGPRTTAEWVALRDSPHAPADLIDAYLHKHADRFLVGGDTPFMQHHGAKTSRGGPDLVGRNALGMIANTTMWSPIDKSHEYSAAHGIRQLVTAHAYDISGIKTGLADDPEAVSGRAYPRGAGWCARWTQLTLQGPTLWDTLTHTAIPLGDDTSVPAWEQPPTPPGDRREPPQGRLDTYTWQSRRILLDTEEGAVVGAVLSAGDRIEWMPELDPAIIVADDKPLRMVNPTRLTWINGAITGESAILAALADAPPTTPLRVGCIAVWQGTKASKWESAVTDQIPLHNSLITDSGVAFEELLTGARRDLGSLVLMLRQMKYLSGGSDLEPIRNFVTLAETYVTPIFDQALFMLAQDGLTEASISRWHGFLSKELTALGEQVGEAHAAPKSWLNPRPIPRWAKSVTGFQSYKHSAHAMIDGFVQMIRYRHQSS